MTTVSEIVNLPAGVDPSNAVATLELVGEGGEPIREVYDQSAGRTVAGFYQFALSISAAWSASLVANDDLLPLGTLYRRTISGRQIPSTFEYGEVPTTGGPYRWDQILASAPATISDSALATHEASTSLHGGGQLLAYADRSTNFTTAATSPTDVTGLTITFTVPAVPYVVECGAFCVLEEGIAGQATVSSGSRTSGVVTLNTSAVHGLTVGQIVLVNVADTTYNGTYAVASVPTTSSLTYAQSALGNDASSGTGTVGAANAPGGAGTLSITLSNNTVVGQNGVRAQVSTDLKFLNRRVVVPNWFHIPTAGTSITYKVRANSSAASSDLTLIATLFSNDAPYIVAYTL